MAKLKHIPKLRFKCFSENWNSKSFRDVVKVNQGLAILKSERFSEEGENRLYYITIPFLEGKLVEYIENPNESVICKEEDVIVTRTGSGLGQVWTNNYGVFHNNFFKVQPTSKSIDKKFVYHYLLSPGIQNKMRKYAGVGAIPDLNHSDFYLIPFFQPELEEQKRISTFLSSIDKKIDQLQHKQSILEQYKKGLMQQLFSQKLRFKDENGNHYTDWEDKCLGEIGKTLNGLTSKTKEDFGIGKPYIQYKQIFDSSKIKIEDCGLVDIAETDNQTKVRYGDIFFTTSSETPNEIGTTSVLLDEVEEMYLNSFCFGLRINGEIIHPSFAQFLFRSENFRKKMIPLAQGSTRYNISKSSFLKLNILIPAIGEQTKIAKYLSAIDAKIVLVDTQIENTLQFKKGLLQQMFV